MISELEAQLGQEKIRNQELKSKFDSLSDNEKRETKQWQDTCSDLQREMTVIQAELSAKETLHRQLEADLKTQNDLVLDTRE